MRCSVSFGNANDLVVGFNQFVNIIDRGSKAEKGCITSILRMKNGFSEMNSDKWINNNNLEKYHYCDVKINVLIETANTKLIGEIQFVLDFMLEAKKMGHVYYSFLRNRDLYNEIYTDNLTKNKFKDNCINIDKNKDKNDNYLDSLKSMVLNQNYEELTNFILYGNFNNVIKYYTNNKDNSNDVISLLVQLCKQNDWQKGLKLLLDSIKPFNLKMTDIDTNVNNSGDNDNGKSSDNKVMETKTDSTTEEQKNSTGDNGGAAVTTTATKSDATEVSKIDKNTKTNKFDWSKLEKNEIGKELARMVQVNTIDKVIDTIEDIVSVSGGSVKNSENDSEKHNDLLNYLLNEWRSDPMETTLVMYAVMHGSRKLLEVLLKHKVRLSPLYINVYKKAH